MRGSNETNPWLGCAKIVLSGEWAHFEVIQEPELSFKRGCKNVEQSLNNGSAVAIDLASFEWNSPIAIEAITICAERK